MIPDSMNTDVLLNDDVDPAAADLMVGQNAPYYRTLTLLILGGVALGVLLVNSLTGGESATAGGFDSAKMGWPGIPYSRTVMSRALYLDTIYTTDSIYLDVDLNRQNVTIHRRDGAARTFRISSGSRFVRDGMETPTGVFTVQNKVPLAISKQFNDAKLYNWVGIQGGVGFHGLDGTGYYGQLGVRPSSHGCVRMSREEIEVMYSMVHPGALILVHKETPARVVAFCAPNDTVGACVIDSAAVYDPRLGNDRLRSILRGNAWTDPRPRMVHLAGQRLRWGMAIGAAARIPRQHLPDLISGPVTDPTVRTIPADRTDTGLRSLWGNAVRSMGQSDSSGYVEGFGADESGA